MCTWLDKIIICIISRPTCMLLCLPSGTDMGFEITKCLLIHFLLIVKSYALLLLFYRSHVVSHTHHIPQHITRLIQELYWSFNSALLYLILKMLHLYLQCPMAKIHWNYFQSTLLICNQCKLSLYPQGKLFFFINLYYNGCLLQVNWSLISILICWNHVPSSLWL